MKRSGPIKRRTPLKRSSGLKQKRKGLASDVRSEVFLRDKGCRGRALIPDLSCWGKLDPHHILRRSQGGQDTPENLVTLCRAHHDWVHAYPESSRQLGLLKRPEAKEIPNDNDH
jgi:5-methylcytosine-specific restriction endonuclease McrA